MKKAFFLIALFTSFVFAASAVWAATEAPDKPVNIGWVTEVKGGATVKHAYSKKRAKAVVGEPIFLNDEIKTGTGATVTVQFEDDSVLTLDERSRVKVTKYVYDKAKKRNKSGFRLFNGRVRGLLNNLFGSTSEMTVSTRTSIAGVKGSDFAVWTDADGEETSVAVIEGKGFMKHSESDRFPDIIALEAGFMAKAKRGTAIGAAVPTPEEVRERVMGLPIRKHKELMEKLRKARELGAEKYREKRESVHDRMKDKMKGHIKDKPPPDVDFGF